MNHVPGHNGRVGMWGISYPGFYAEQGAIDAHPALKAVSPQAPVTDWFVGDDFHHNGAFFLAHAFNFFVNFDRSRSGPVTKYGGVPFEHGTPDGYRFFLDLGPLRNATRYFGVARSYWREMMDHPNGDEYWQACDARRGLRQVRPAVMTVGGWFDAEDLFGALKVYEAVERHSPGGDNRLVMGPWSHGAWARTDGDQLGDVRFFDKTAVFYREKIEFPFFQHYLKDAGEATLPEMYAFATGTNEWHALDSWPPREATAATFYFAPHGGLVRSAPREDEAFDEYPSDPSRPVPCSGETAIGMPKEYMVADQRFAARRPDVLVYQTPVLDEDLVVAGPIRASLTVSTTGTDSDWIVKLIDVYPDDYPDPDPNPTRVKMGGYQQLGARRAHARSLPQQLRAARRSRRGCRPRSHSRCPTCATCSVAATG
ncbi:MAG: CocE/NonD family hydrolase [Planctomycetota bacterium]